MKKIILKSKAGSLITLLSLATLLISSHTYAQRIHVNGQVFDSYSRQSLPGATIQVKGSAATSVADADGKFRMYAEIGDILLVRYIGFVEQEIEASEDEQQVSIYLKENLTELSEVQVTAALGFSRSAKELGSSAQIVDADELNQGKTVNPLFGLSSKVAGLRINMYDSKVDPAAQVVLRGNRSLQRSSGIDGRNPNEPIYVVDGVPIPDISRLNPNDIESITVLKGANAAALYGSEGVNGALMITTKKGRKGEGIVRISNTTTFSNVYFLPEAQTTYGQGNNGVYSPTTFESWGPAFDGSSRPFGTPLPDGTQPMLTYAAPGRDNRLDLFQTGVNVQNDVSFSGGDDVSTYFLSAQYVTQSGIIPQDQNDRVNLRFNGSRDFGKLKTSYNFNFINNKKDVTPDGPWIASYRMPANFDYGMIRDWEDLNSPGNPNNYFIPNGSWLRNPYFLIDNIRDQSNQQILNGKIELNYNVAPWMDVLYRVGMYSSSDEIRSFTNKYEAEGTRNTPGSVNDQSIFYRRLNSDLIISLKKDFGDFSNRLLIGQNIRTDYRKTQNVSASNLLYTDIINQSSRQGELAGGSGITEQRSLAVYGEYVAGYKDLLFVTFTGRNDWISTLSRENRSYFYPGVSASFVASDAIPALRQMRKLSYAKLYTSWNKTGNVTLTPYQLNNAYTQSNGFPFGNNIGFLPGLTNPNPNIMPEFVTSYEAGFQVGLFNHRLYLEGAYVYSDADGQISNANISRATGYNAMLVNSGRMTNNIIELTVSGDVIRTMDWNWNLGFNFTHTNNVVRELYGGADFRQNFRQSYAFVGDQFPMLWVSDYQRAPDGRVVVDAETGDPIVAPDNVKLGPMVPPFMLGFTSRLEYKGFSLIAQFDGRMGGWFYSETIPPMYEFGTHPITAAYGREAFVWPNSVIETSPGVYVDNTDLLTSGGGKEFWTRQGAVQSNTAAKADFFKLRELNLSYTLPNKLLEGQKLVRSATVGVVATNLFVITHSSNNIGDPEYLYNNTDGYYSFRQVPPMRTVGFSVNASF
ncbi:SusC/RagA family TonB-linked outer membrane protein [Belliella sp. DSM 111904]|uniref:SusC/RagA family TonB-linked outer membrane protein n=1 Tax=Belliella filtrata TaxID=2923435 RepID=A0ABS9V028_9BACT|nr:SusC/RagA family TonB-linked outer membrane protein [Belliella filtrata]MCH7409772.1 SusC/RagA family TonB-linked outer membrane protein [Belliella filtrata]